MKAPLQTRASRPSERGMKVRSYCHTGLLVTRRARPTATRPGAAPRLQTLGAQAPAEDLPGETACHADAKRECRSRVVHLQQNGSRPPGAGVVRRCLSPGDFAHKRPESFSETVRIGPPARWRGSKNRKAADRAHKVIHGLSPTLVESRAGAARADFSLGAQELLPHPRARPFPRVLPLRAGRRGGRAPARHVRTARRTA